MVFTVVSYSIVGVCKTDFEGWPGLRNFVVSEVKGVRECDNKKQVTKTIITTSMKRIIGILIVALAVAGADVNGWMAMAKGRCGAKGSQENLVQETIGRFLNRY